MIEVSRVVPVPPETVFDVLADGWSYAGWVVGSSHIRAVDDGWPAEGARIHHSVGAWPLQLEDTTSVQAVVPRVSLFLEARGGILGTADITIILAPHGDGETLVRMAETVRTGIGGLLPESLQRLLLSPRNEESLARLSDLAAGRAGRSQP
ncbi:SRPBCC family protein [Amycolatopsis rubida]|uniref:Polyketide cyclase / dehydrase and lipid transport n=1 Tax=Amycolatopsis rubida TaxID=112413 RepID=A0A1I5KJ40_9PSEU|nr:SRPBCC family protein [Amycolatopsis rubida]SFO84571.1 Polyketide cyclase / dehydrase and lipid transport [Amycolatopsis rubida]